MVLQPLFDLYGTERENLSLARDYIMYDSIILIYQVMP